MTGDDAVAGLVDAVCREARRVPGDVAAVVASAVDRLAPLSSGPERELVIARSIARLDGLDVLQELLDDPTVDEVMVNHGSEVWIDRGDGVRPAAELAPGAIDVILERVLSPLGKRLDRTTPIVDARLAGGARLCAVVEPVAVDGTTVTVRRHRHRAIAVGEFAADDVCRLLAEVVHRRCNVLVTGATSSGKTTLLAALTRLAGAGERLVVIEDTAELALDGRHAVRLEARPATHDGVRAIGLTELVRTALRLRPDRLIVGEFRGDEALATVQALNTGHDGSLSTCHANSAVDGLRRLETLVLQAAPSWPLPAIRLQTSRSIDVVVHVRRAGHGRRAVDEIIEVVESADEPAGRVLARGGDVLAALARGRR